VVCPWCFIGSTRLNKVLAAWNGKADVVYKPFMLRPDAPESGLDTAEMLRKRTGRDPKELAQTTSDAQHTAEQGIRGVPFFIFNKKLAVSGAEPEEILLQALNEAA